MKEETTTVKPQTSDRDRQDCWTFTSLFLHRDDECGTIFLEEEVNFIFEFVSSYCDKQTVYDASLSWCQFNIPGVILQMWAETLTTLPHQDETLGLVSVLKITNEVCFYSSVWGVCVHWCVQWPWWWMVKLGSLWREQTRSSSPLTRIFPTVSLCSPAAEEESKSK